MASTKRLSSIYEIQNFANTYLGKVTKFQGNGLFRFGVPSHLLGRRWKTPSPLPTPGSYMVKMTVVGNEVKLFLVKTKIDTAALVSDNVLLLIICY